MRYKTGAAKPLEEITLEDAIQHLIWEWALDGETVEGQDETWQRPIIDTNDVTDEMVQPTITLRIKETGQYACAEYNLDEDILESISVWENDQWISIFDKEELTFPTVFVSLPTIIGVPNAEFEMADWKSDIATRI